MITKEAIEQLQKSAQAPTEIGMLDRKYLMVPENMKAIAYQPAEPKYLSVISLAGIVEYLKNSNPMTELWDYLKDGQYNKYLVHIKDYRTVRVMSPLEPTYMTRRCFVEAKAPENAFQSGRYMSIGEFIVYVMANFGESEDRSDLLEFVSKMKGQASREEVDEGITQEVTVKQGVASISMAQVPNPVALKAYVTFSEITQPIRSYVFRVKQRKIEDPITCALFEVESNHWQVEATDGIREFFKMNKDMPDLPAVVIS